MDVADHPRRTGTVRRGDPLPGTADLRGAGLRVTAARPDILATVRSGEHLTPILGGER